MNAIDSILELELLGFIFTLKDNNIHYTHQGDKPTPALVHSLLDVIKENKDEAIEYLQKRRDEVDFGAHLFSQADLALEKGDLDRWIRLLEAASMERSRSYARNEYDRHRCPKCPNLGRGPLYEMGGELVLCDVTCLDTEDTHKSGSNPITSPNQAEVQDVSENADDVTDAGT